MEGSNGERVLNCLVRVLCVVVPLGLFWGLSLFRGVVAEPLPFWVAGCIVFTWSVAIGWRMRVARRTAIFRLHKNEFFVLFAEHGVVFCLASLMLDGGLTLYACILAGMLYWMMAGLVVTQCRALPTPIDGFLVTYGFGVLAFAVSLAFWILYTYRGY